LKQVETIATEEVKKVTVRNALKKTSRASVSDGPSEDGQQRRIEPIDDRINVSSRVDVTS
jgi:hypothetical protein